jgi:enoyl-[acyl-carrier protein] reductase/trans-2-enoyl-CoA reductase (NAD+)
VREKFGQLDLLVYSMAAPVRTDPDTGVTYRSAIKPLGAPVEIKTLNTETGEVYETTIAPATEDEATATVAVMGGDDWKRWIDRLADAGVLAPGFRTLNYTYIGSELTWPIYWKGTLGRAKVDLDRKADAIRARLGQDASRVVALKAVVTQASSAIPVVPLYGTVLFKVMKKLGLHEGCIEQIDRLFRTSLGSDAKVDDALRLRLDDWELSSEVQTEVLRRWPRCPPKRSVNWRTCRNTRASFCACSGSASMASTIPRTSIRASCRARRSISEPYPAISCARWNAGRAAQRSR